MARVTKADIKNAMDHLRESGLNPSVAKILEITGKGSNSTILKLRTQIYKEESQLLDEVDEKKLLSCVRDLMGRSFSKLSACTGMEIDQLTLENDRKASEIALLQLKVKDLESLPYGVKLESCLSEIQLLKEKERDLKETLKEKESVISYMSGESATLKDTIIALKKQNSDFHKSLTHFRDSQNDLKNQIVAEKDQMLAYKDREIARLSALLSKKNN